MDDFKKLHGGLSREEIEYQSNEAFKLEFGEGEEGVQEAKNTIDVITDSQDESYQKAIKAAQYVAAKPKLMAATKVSSKKLDKLMKDLEYLLKENGFEYSITTQRFDCFPNSISVIVETEAFSTSANDHIIFRDIINSIDSFGSSQLTNGNIQYSFSINDMFTDFLQNKNKPKNLK